MTWLDVLMRQGSPKNGLLPRPESLQHWQGVALPLADVVPLPPGGEGLIVLQRGQ